ncbi:MAG: hypothetical protein ACHQX1_01065 [Candidatus Micrarchaeales archaeon]
MDKIIDKYIVSLHLGLSAEHRAFIRDLMGVIISYTPVSGITDTIKFSHKWFGKKRSIRRTIKYMKNVNRKTYIKKRNKKIKEAYSRLARRYNLDPSTPIPTIAKITETNKA